MQVQGRRAPDSKGRHLLELVGVRARVARDGAPLRPGALDAEQARAGRSQLVRARALHRRQQRHLRPQLVPGRAHKGFYSEMGS